MGSVKIALAAGLALLVVAIAVTLARSPMVLARKNGTPLKEERIAMTFDAATYCQGDELLPAGTTAIRLSLSAYTGPSVSVRVSAGGHAITGGTRGSGWTGRVVTVPVRALARAVPATTVCASFRPHDEHIIVFGKTTPPASAAHDGPHALAGRMWIEYLRPGSRTWASLAPSTARRLGLGRVAAGTWNALLVVELLAAIVGLASMLVLGELA